MATNNYTATNAEGVTYALTYDNGILGVGANYTLVITYPNGSSTTVDNIPPGNVLTSDGGSLSIVSILAGSTYVIPPGVTGAVTIVAAAGTLSPNVLYVGGTATIASGASLLAGMTINVDGGNATLTSGFVASGLSGTTVNLDNGGTFSNGVSLISALSGTTVDFGTGGGTFVANGGGAIINLSGTTINGFDASTDTLSFTGLPEDSVANYTITTSGGSQTITALDASGGTIATATVAGTSFTDGTYSSSGAGPLTVADTGTTLTIVAGPSVCFLPGTLIQTVSGEVAVENIRVGDQVVVHGSDSAGEVVWVGSKHVRARTDIPLDMAGYPVRVLQNAIADSVPHKDLLITPEHCLFLEGKLVPVRMLVNGRNVFYDTSITSYHFYHVETAQHSIIYADGMPTETYLDTGNRRSFQQPAGTARLPGRVKSWAEDAAAPLAVEQAFVEPLFRMIEARADAASLPRATADVPVTTDADLHLVTNTGRILHKTREANGQVVFMIPGDVTTVHIVSRASRPSDVVGPFVDDRRHLGVLVGDITLWDADEMRKIDTHLTTRSLTGWNALERTPCRWTNGNAVLSLGDRKTQAIGMLGVKILAAGPYLVEAQQDEPVLLSA